MLVTSHTTKALRMVRSQIVPELRSLSVSLLESDLDSHLQLESAVSSIADRLSRTDAKSLEFETERLTQERAELLNQLAELRQQLADARAYEYRDVVVGGRAWTPSEAARKIARESDVNGWIPGPVQLGVELPLSGGDLVELYATNRTISPDLENELSGNLPSASELPAPADFEDLLVEKARLENQITNSEPTFGKAVGLYPQMLWRRSHPHSTNPSLFSLATRGGNSRRSMQERMVVPAGKRGKNCSPSSSRYILRPGALKSCSFSMRPDSQTIRSLSSTSRLQPRSTAT